MDSHERETPMPSPNRGREPMNEQNGVTARQQDGLDIDPEDLDTEYVQVASGLMVKRHPDGRLGIRVRASEDRNRWNEYSLPLTDAEDA